MVEVSYFVFCHLLHKFFKTSSKICFRNAIIRVSNGLEPDQDNCSVGPDHAVAASKLLAKGISNRLIFPKNQNRFAKSVVCCSVDV